MDIISKKQLIFANMFRVSNRLQTTMDNSMKDITSKQWFVLTALSTFEEPPTLKELAYICDTSHQNTKQIVKKLEEKHYLYTEKDVNDKRAIRIVLTDKINQWELENRDNAASFIETMFSDLTEDDISTTLKSLLSIYEKLEFISIEKI